MHESAKAGLTLVGLAIAIVLGLLVLTLGGPSSMLWADLIFGIVSGGLLLVGLFVAKHSAD